MNKSATYVPLYHYVCRITSAIRCVLLVCYGIELQLLEFYVMARLSPVTINVQSMTNLQLSSLYGLIT